MRQLVFVVEDDNTIRELVSQILEEDFHVFGFSNITAFEQCVRKIRPSLVLLDVNLPDGNGVEACRRLKKNETFRETPVLLMSGDAVPSESLRRSGAESFIGKPFNLTDLKEMTQQYVASRVTVSR
ncbi:response regulator [Parapedobacter sp. ISTM3]|uniref:response regulator n=1 Tax=Parapedobacter sp. ISTM3 TaxID=2800130 RepID=UPI001905F78F|nr:response regulator [Parapedobacter sp. ISTM3]MBK1439840.1 response regulator [Parapedobacter sp. ISTM3]